ncbi:MAG: GH3 auxin-responsive promoter family protein [Clostridia bacterium]|nr:GH3 auxin-responsive promoter family protein [Clostridia bacterium]
MVESDAEQEWDACIDELEGYMGVCNKRYPSQREKAFISRLIVQRQQPGTHDAWGARCVAQGASAAQIKPVHSLDNEAKREFFLSRLVPSEQHENA